MSTDLAIGTGFAALASALSCLLTFVGFGRSYYLGVFLPLFMLAYILIAWILYLRDDSFMGSPSRMKRAGDTDALSSRASPAVDTGCGPGRGPGVDAFRSPESLLRVAARWDEEPLRRADTASSPSSGMRPEYRAGAGAGLVGMKRALLFAAAELGLAASLLYSLFGIGAVYFS